MDPITYAGLKAISTFDWISPTSAMVNIALGDAMLWVPARPGQNGGDIVKLLKSHGITVRTMGRMVVQGHYGMCVPRDQLQRARELSGGR